MENNRHFKAWLRMVRRYDWSPPQRQASALRAFAALQQAVSRCGPAPAPGASRSCPAERVEAAPPSATEARL